ncbi:hypothetical protein OSB04_027798 [Centaurea solstitialis]|uniref:PGG domain-containing protein n=1 Tax=Centaurea solstitialis TaxID=347529 RepID=A0AA38W012_9ASTR|nr:hypothetical protein OSB04_027798 [Centaurea solstitialis]
MLCVPLYQASNRGDWKEANIVFNERPQLNLVRYSITENHETALHIAVSAKYSKRQENFVKELVGLMMKEGGPGLQLKNGNGETALHVAAVAGNVGMARIIVEASEALLTIPDSKGQMPLCVAALYGKGEMVKYLYTSSKRMTGEGPNGEIIWTHEKRDYVLLKCIEADLFDTALQIVIRERSPVLATSGNALRILAQKPEAFQKERNTTLMKATSSATTRACSALQLLRIICDSILRSRKNVIDDIMRGPPDQPTLDVQNPKYSSQMLFIAVEKGNTTFVVELIRRYPDLIRMVNDMNQSLFHVAVSHRHKDICSLLYQIGSIKDSVITLQDENGNNMLHLVGERAKGEQLQDVAGVVLQMQQELQWFEEVEAILPPFFREMKNNDGLTPHQLFTKTHKDLVSNGEKWLKEIAAQLMVVAALIATIAFVGPFNVPGGLNQETGSPIFRHGKHFIAFMVLDAISFLFSSASILLLISILTSRYAERDFVETLPKKLLICLATLFNALTTMIASFFVNFFILYEHNAFVAFSYLLVPVFFSLQYPIFVGMFRSIYSRSRRSIFPC